MKYIIHFVILILLISKVKGQTLQSKIVPFEGNPTVLGIDQWEDKFIVSTISFIEDTVGSTFIFIDSELSATGEVEFRGFAVNNGGVFIRDKNYFVFGNNNRESEFVTLKKSGEYFGQSEDFNFLTNSEFNFTNTAIQLDSHIYALTVDTYFNPDRKQSFFQKIDLAGNEIWNQTIGENETYSAGIDISATESGHLLIGSIIIDDGKTYSDLMKLDQEGNEDWDYQGSENTLTGYSSHRTIELSDNNLINISTVDRSQNSEFIINEWSFRPPMLSWLNSTGEFQRDTLFTSSENEPYTYSKLIKGRGDYFFICGSKGNIEFLDGDFGWICKMSNEGEIIWNRKYHHTALINEGYFHNITDIQEADCGDLITIGTATLPGQHQQIWVMRLNPNGCFDDEVCGDISTSTSETLTPTTKLKIFPNPTSGFFNLDLDQVVKSEIEGILILDGTGKVIFEEYYNPNTEMIDVSYLETGLYIVRLYLENGMTYSKKLILK